MADEQVTYNEVLVVFRDLCEDNIYDQLYTNEYIRGGVELIAWLFPVMGVPTDERKDRVVSDLRRIPMFADPNNLERHGVKPYVRYPQEGQ